MALTPCPKCGRYISDKAVSCPGCHYQCESTHSTPHSSSNTTTVKPESITQKKYFLPGIILAIIVCVSLIATMDSTVSSSVPRRSPSSTTSYGNRNSQVTQSYVPKTPNEKAVDQAKSYLGSSAFSYEGLIDQLMFHGYSESEATYGAKNCGANWSEQALKKAKSYLNSSAFSYSGLLEQLEYEGFTASEAQYGVDRCGADWNQQAVKKAQSYLRIFSNWTYSDLLEQLEYEGFTYQQAKYGADSCI